AAAQAAGQVEGQPELKIYKNNVDGKGASYGAHENYLYPRSLNVEDVHQALVPHFVTRQIYAGAGRVGLGQAGEQAGFQISQRADYIETEVSLETTLNRGIVNTRDEPHATADDWRRLHVIIGDANLSQFATYLRFGTTALVLKAVEAGADFSDIVLIDPVEDVRRVSRDLELKTPLRLYGNTTATAIELQRRIRETVIGALEPAGKLTTDEQRVLALWEEILDDLEADPLRTSDRLDWTAKYALLQGYRARGLEWSDPRMALIDIQYHDIDPARGLYHALVARGKMRTLVDDSEIAAAVDTPPRGTRAWLRGALVKHYAPKILATNWDSVVLEHPHDGHPALRVGLPEPLQSTAGSFAGTVLENLAEAEPGQAPEFSEVAAALIAALPERVMGVG
ncbi:depupylase/deamidase Dop, partial [Corynebacterium sp.]